MQLGKVENRNWDCGQPHRGSAVSTVSGAALPA